MYSDRYISDRIKTRRTELKFTKTELAKKLSADEHEIDSIRIQLTKWESGTRIPETSSLCRLCNALDCDIEYLLGAIDAPHRATHDVMEQTGLNIGAVNFLISLKHRSDTEKEKGYIGFMAFATHKLKALSYILENNTVGVHDFLSTLYSLTFGDYNRISLSDRAENGEMVTISALNAALTNSELKEVGDIIRVGDMQNIFLVNLQEFLLDLRDKAQGKDRHKPSITVEM